MKRSKRRIMFQLLAGCLGACLCFSSCASNPGAESGPTAVIAEANPETTKSLPVSSAKKTPSETAVQTNAPESSQSSAAASSAKREAPSSVSPAPAETSPSARQSTRESVSVAENAAAEIGTPAPAPTIAETSLTETQPPPTMTIPEDVPIGAVQTEHLLDGEEAGTDITVRFTNLHTSPVLIKIVPIVQDQGYKPVKVADLTGETLSFQLEPQEKKDIPLTLSKRIAKKGWYEINYSWVDVNNENTRRENSVEIFVREIDGKLYYDHLAAAKPVVYLYPQEKTHVSVRLDLKGKLTCTYPEYGKGWEVDAFPDGTLQTRNGKEYSYLFWEGETGARYDFSSGFVVEGEETADFLQYTLSRMGLTPREYNEMIVYWYPRMKDNPYNLISFQDRTYTDSATLAITPKPDSLLRVFMAYRPLEKPISVPYQEIKPFERKGFTVVEWGGAEVPY